jgi:thymidine kinase
MQLTEEVFKRKNESGGSIEVICGSMFSGKTEELIRRINRVRIAKLRYQVFKPKQDTRYDKVDVVSHNSNAIISIPVAKSEAILLQAGHNQVIGIDEAQFFDDKLPDVCNSLASSGIRVIIAGLDMDFKGRPFGPMPALLAIADSVTKVHAVCVVCGNAALYSYRKVPGKNKIMLGELESYEPLCRVCYNLVRA